MTQKLLHILATLDRQSRLLKVILKQLRKISNNYDMVQSYCQSLGTRVTNIEEIQHALLSPKDTDISEIIDSGGIENGNGLETSDSEDRIKNSDS